ncbi:MAG TPA: hypothetical protein VIQ03_10250 [Gammaproteobacteria bacterium]
MNTINRIKYLGKVKWLALFLACTTIYAAPPTLFFEEGFENNNLISRGWYDNTDIVITTSEYAPNSAASAQFTFNAGSQTPTSGGSIRRSFPETEEVYVSYYVKYSANWQGSNLPYHPHEFYLLTNLDGEWNGLSDTHMTAYIEQNEGVPRIAIQDSQNIDENNIGVDLTNVTENRAAAGCNGVSGAAQNNDDCYQYGGPTDHRNETIWSAGQIYFSDSAGPTYKNDWHRVEAYLKMNTVTNGRGNYDGIVQYRFDGQLIVNHNDVLFRTGQHPNMRFDMLAIGPYIGAGSPITQTMWVDNLIVATSKIDEVRPMPPSNLTVQ